MPTQTRVCSLSDLRPELGPKLRQYISGSERILLCCETKYEEGALSQLVNLAFLNPSKAWWFAQAITDSTLVVASITQYSKTASAMRLADIASVRETGSSEFFTVIAHGPGEAKAECVLDSPSMSQKFANMLRQAIDQAKGVRPISSAQPAQTLEERLRVLTQLHKDGLISDEEYQQKRKEILGQL